MDAEAAAAAAVAIQTKKRQKKQRNSFTLTKPSICLLINRGFFVVFYNGL
jgi:hypothetical protein